MDAFGARELAFELAFAHDEEVRFRIVGRRNGLMAKWAADRLGFVGDTAARYIETIADGLGAQPSGRKSNEERVIAKLVLDLTIAGWALGDEDLRKILADFERQAQDAVAG